MGFCNPGRQECRENGSLDDGVVRASCGSVQKQSTPPELQVFVTRSKIAYFADSTMRLSKGHDNNHRLHAWNGQGDANWTASRSRRAQDISGQDPCRLVWQQDGYVDIRVARAQRRGRPEGTYSKRTRFVLLTRACSVDGETARKTATYRHAEMTGKGRCMAMSAAPMLQLRRLCRFTEVCMWCRVATSAQFKILQSDIFCLPDGERRRHDLRETMRRM